MPLTVPSHEVAPAAWDPRAGDPATATRSYHPPARLTHPVSHSRSSAGASRPRSRPVRSTSWSRVAASHPTCSSTSRSAGSGSAPAVGRPLGPTRTQIEGDQHVVGGAGRRPPLGQQRVGARRRRVAHGTGHGEHVAPPSVGLVDRVEGPAPGVRLDHDHDVGERGDDAVAGREPPALGPGARAAPRTAAPRPARPRCHSSCWWARVDDVEPAAHHADGRRPAGGQRTAVGGAVDAGGEARHDRHARPPPGRGPSSNATPRPVAEQRRVPTIATRGPPMAPRSPWWNTTAGGSTSAASRAG